MTKTLYVGNLPWSTTEDDMRSMFASEANIEVESVRLINDRETGRSKGFGFVELDEQYLEQAIQSLNGLEYGGRALTVNEARPREERPRRY